MARKTTAVKYELKREKTAVETALLVAVWCTFFPLPGPATFLVWQFRILFEFPWILIMTGISTVFGLALAWYVINVLRTVRREGITLTRNDKIQLWLEVIFGFVPMLFWIFMWAGIGITVWLVM